VVENQYFYVREDAPSLLEKVFEIKKIVELILRMISAVVNSF
jgi:hypothetical protein